MNIIASRQEKRAKQIAEIQESITKAQLQNIQLTYKTIILSTSANLNLSNRTAKEYVDVALFNLGMKKEDLNGKQ